MIFLAHFQVRSASWFGQNKNTGHHLIAALVVLLNVIGFGVVVFVVTALRDLHYEAEIVCGSLCRIRSWEAFLFSRGRELLFCRRVQFRSRLFIRMSLFT